MRVDNEILWKDSRLADYIICIACLILIIFIIGLIIYNRNGPHINITIVAIVFFMIIVFLLDDKYKFKRNYITPFVIFFLLLIIMFQVSFIFRNYFPNYIAIPFYDFLIGLVFITLSLSGFHSVVKRRFPYIAKKGIFTGNRFIIKNRIKTAEEAYFIEWFGVKEIKIVERQVAGGRMVDLSKFIYITATTGEEFKFPISDWKGFEKITQHLGKGNILKKDFKYSKIIDSDISDREREKRCDELEKKEEVLEV